jgi:hypothetical protein
MKKIITVASLVFSAAISGAQVADYSFQHQQGLYTPLQSYTNVNFTEHQVLDDFVWPEKIKMPFAFKFGNYQADSIGISENAFVWFGSARSNDFSAIHPISTQLPATVKGVISILGTDMHPHLSTGLTSRIRTAVLGTAPFRFAIIEWQNTSRYETVGVGEDTMSFQLKLYETTNRVEMVFGHFGMHSTVSTNVEVGLKGASLTDFNNRAVSAMDWSASVPGIAPTRKSVLSRSINPSFGQIFVWNPPVPNSIEDNEKEEDMVLFPVPAMHSLSVKGKDYTNSSYSIYTVQGSVVAKGRIEANSINVALLPAGYYTLEVNDRNRIVRKGFTK